MSDELLARLNHRERPARSSLIWRLAATAGLVAVGALVITLWAPQPAFAQAIKQVNTAVTDAKSMVATVYRERPNGSLFKAVEIRHADGKWRTDRFPGTAAHWTFLYGPHDLAVRVAHENRVYFASPGGEPQEALTALQYVRQLSQGGAPQPADASVEEHPPVNGRPAYKIVATRAEDSLRSTVVVDKATDLPINSVSETIQASSRKYRKVVGEYTFNAALEPSTFSSDALQGRRYDCNQLSQELKGGLGTALDRTEEGDKSAEIRGLFTDPQGLVYVISRLDGQMNAVHEYPLPTTVKDQRGGEYVRLRDLPPGASFGWLSSSAWEETGAWWLLTVFAPLDGKSGEGPMLISTAKRSITYYGLPSDWKFGPALSTRAFAPTKLSEEDSYRLCAAWFLVGYRATIAAAAAELRGDSYAERGDYDSALAHYTQQLEIHRKTAPYGSWVILERIAAMNEKLGRIPDAAAARAQAAEDRSTDPNQRKG